MKDTKAVTDVLKQFEQIGKDRDSRIQELTQLKEEQEKTVDEWKAKLAKDKYNRSVDALTFASYQIEADRAVHDLAMTDEELTTLEVYGSLNNKHDFAKTANRIAKPAAEQTLEAVKDLEEALKHLEAASERINRGNALVSTGLFGLARYSGLEDDIVHKIENDLIRPVPFAQMEDFKDGIKRIRAAKKLLIQQCDRLKIKGIMDSWASWRNEYDPSKVDVSKLQEVRWYEDPNQVLYLIQEKGDNAEVFDYETGNKLTLPSYQLCTHANGKRLAPGVWDKERYNRPVKCRTLAGVNHTIG